jgi:UrcA family protein
MHAIRSLIPIVLLSTLVAATPAAASQKIVSYADLDLTNPEGIAKLDRRIQSAVRDVCGRAYPADLQSIHDVRRCRANSLADVQPQRSKALAQNNSSVQLAARQR